MRGNDIGIVRAALYVCLWNRTANEPPARSGSITAQSSSSLGRFRWLWSGIVLVPAGLLLPDAIALAIVATTTSGVALAGLVAALMLLASMTFAAIDVVAASQRPP